MNKMRAVRAEYGEPFAEVVKGYAEMGYSRTLTAEVLGISLKYFRQLCDRFDLHKHFKPQAEMRRDCKGGGHGWEKGAPKFGLRAPIRHNGVVWYPGEPTHNFLYSTLSQSKRRRKTIQVNRSGE